MTRPREREVAPLIQRDWALFLDADGTLLELAPTPDEVIIPGTLLPQLRAMRVALSGALAIVSGRSLAQLHELFPGAPCMLVGQHGLECDAWPSPFDTTVDHGVLLASARNVSDRFPGVVVEDKGAGIALHWRRNPGAEHALRQLARDYVDTLDGYMVQPGKMVVEVRPQGGKRDALRYLMDRMPWRGRYPVFVGDDLTDESGFVEASRRGGIGILVGEDRASAATHRLDDVESVHAWLAESLAELQCPGDSCGRS